MASQEAHEFHTGLVDQYGRLLKASRPNVELVGNVTGNAHRVYPRGGTDDPDSAPLPRLSRRAPVAGDRVLVVTLADGSRAILGKLYESGEDDGVIHTNQSSQQILGTLTIQQGAGVEVLRLEDDGGSEFVEVRGDQRTLRMYTKDDDTAVATIRMYNGTDYTVNIHSGTDNAGSGGFVQVWDWDRANITYLDGANSTIHANNGDFDRVYSTLLGNAIAPNTAAIASGRYIGPESLVPVTGSGTLAMAANRCYAVPIVFNRSGTVNQIGVEITTAAAGILRMALYNASGGLPTDRLNTPAGISSGTTGVKTFTVSTDVQGGKLYYLAVGVTVAGVSIRSFSPGKSWFGAATAGEINRYSMCYDDQTAGWGSMPDPWVNSGYEQNSMVAVHARLA